ncbi:MAG: hypothetical protein H6602_14565 [Flavobacteriales bacterium]|nr:hypothetical protein [Flavobacteriales bacterium]
MSQTQIIEQITKLTMKLRNSNPEVYKQLDENPITLNMAQGQGATDRELQEYLETLQDLLKDHKG